MSDPTADVKRVITIDVPVIPEEKFEMSGQFAPIDLPPNLASQQLARAADGVGMMTEALRGTLTMAVGSLQAGIAKDANKIGTEEARALSGLNSTPLGAPSGNKAQA